MQLMSAFSKMSRCIWNKIKSFRRLTIKAVLSNEICEEHIYWVLTLVKFVWIVQAEEIYDEGLPLRTTWLATKEKIY